MAILGIALTSTSCHLAWHHEDEFNTHVVPMTLGQTHAGILVPLIKKFLTMKPTVVATTTGPGSFTSIRIQLATAIGLKIGYGAQLFCPNTLDLLEASFKGSIPVIDSFRGDYFTKFQSNIGCLTLEELEILKKQGKKFCGDIGKIPENIAELLVKFYLSHPSPKDVCNPEPMYVRTPDYKTRANYQG